MKVLRELKLKKIFKSLLKGSLKTNVFLILLGIFFSSLALAATLTLTHKDNRIPAGANTGECFSSKISDESNGGEKGQFVDLDHDRTENLRDIVWSDDGTMVFTINNNMNKKTTNKGPMGDLDLSMNKVRDPFELSTVKTSLGIHTCDDIDGFDVDHVDFAADGLPSDGISSNGTETAYRSIHVASGGKIFYILRRTGEVNRYDLSVPYDFRTAKYIQRIDLATNTKTTGFSLNRDGTRLYQMDSGADDDTPVITTFSLSPAFDITSATEIQSTNLYTDLGTPDLDGDQSFRDIEFSYDGSAMFVSAFDVNSPFIKNRIYQFSLSKNFDVSTGTLIGFHNFLYSASPGGALRSGSGRGALWGFSFSSDGMRLFISQADDGTAVDNIYQFDLECPFGVVACVSDPTASISSQVELAKQNITLNISSIFYRFEWIKRNRDEENFTSHNININYPNPLLKSLAMSLEPAAKKKIVTLVNTPKKDQKKSKWSSWSLGDLSLSNFDKLGFENAKSIRTEGITFGADRKFSDNKFFGWAIRYGNGRSNIVNTKQNIHMDSLTLNLYGVMPKDKEKYLNAVLGLSALKIDSHYLGKKSGQRYGKQLFTAIDFRTKNTYSKLNLTPTTKLTFGITRLGEYTDFISDAISPAQNIRYHEDTFTSGQISSGFLFETDQIIINDKTFQPMGGMEFYYDLTSDIDYDYSLVGSNQVNTDTINGAYSVSNLRTRLGFELIYPDGLTLSPMYEKTFAIKGSPLNYDDFIDKAITERFIIKISRSKETDENNFALDFDPLNQNYANISFNKNLGNLNLKLNSNYSLYDKIPDYGVNLEISGNF